MVKQNETSPESVVRKIERNTRKKYGADEKVRIDLEGLSGETAIADICRREGIYTTMYYKWSKTFLEAGNIHFFCFKLENCCYQTEYLFC
jgi:transposase